MERMNKNVSHLQKCSAARIFAKDKEVIRTFLDAVFVLDAKNKKTSSRLNCVFSTLMLLRAV
ncbi:unnamed protein product [Amoebophrya sp. A120]|nr:unnamed protein product [Amoebophrya sp. A120]|eukprot:GSA120T00009906001.1